MPVLAALDECLTILVKISNLADGGLADSTKQQEALTQIQRCCNEIDETIHGIALCIDDDDGTVPAAYRVH